MPQEELLNIDEAKDIKPQLDKIPEKFLRQLVKQAGHWADYQKYTDMMNGIAFQMKEIPVLPSEQHNPEDTNALEKVSSPRRWSPDLYEWVRPPVQGIPAS